MASDKSQEWSDEHDHDKNSVRVVVGGREAKQCQVCWAYQFYSVAGVEGR